MRSEVAVSISSHKHTVVYQWAIHPLMSRKTSSRKLSTLLAAPMEWSAPNFSHSMTIHGASRPHSNNQGGMRK